MMSYRSDQHSLFAADTQYLDFVGADSFYGFLARHGRELFCDEAFEGLYCPDFGRPSVPPSLLAIALLSQAHDRVSDAQATDRAAFDMRWEVTLSAEMDQRPFAKSTLQLFRAQLLIHEQAGAIFRRSLAYARETGYLKGRRSRLVVDSTLILGRGAVEDTYNLIAHGIAKLCRVLAGAHDAATRALANLTLVASRMAPEGVFGSFFCRLLGRLCALTASLALICGFRATGERKTATVLA